jgi:hypothetical protein
MRRSSPRRGRRWAVPAAAGLIAATSALATGGFAVWSAPPRYDGAGYAVLARALHSGQGYRAIDHPDRPRHAHFPPGYPLVLALTWSLTGESTRAAHVLSAGCTVGACLAAWWWFRRLLSPAAALVLGLALSVNWLWARTGGSIQSEPLYLLLEQLTILAALRAGRRRLSGTPDAIGLGVLLAACLLTRQAAIGLAMAVLLDLALRRRWGTATIVGATAVLVISPWLAWLAAIGRGSRTQAGLLLSGGATGFGGIAGQLVFYVQRIPDQITGPFVEVGTVFQDSPQVALLAIGWAVLATAVIACGWVCTLRRSRRRLAGLIPCCSLVLLVVWPYTEAGRFLVPLIPCILIGAVEGLTVLWGGWERILGVGPRWHPARRRLVAAGLVWAASLPYPAYLLGTGRAWALEASQQSFDAACAWLAAAGDRPGPVLTRHPGEVFWQTGRPALEVPTAERPGDRDADAAAIARTIAAYRVAYLLIDQQRYAGAPASPLARFVIEAPHRVRKVWSRESQRTAVAIYEVLPSP